jgi:hypothetical protein
MIPGDDKWTAKIADLAAGMLQLDEEAKAFETANGMITLNNRHGTFTANAFLVEQSITKFLPASVNDFRLLFKDLGYREDYSDVHYISEWLVILASECPELIDNPEFKASWKMGRAT